MRTIYTYIRQARSINFECKGTSLVQNNLDFHFHLLHPPPKKKVGTNFIIINVLYVDLRRGGKELYYLKEGCINSICWHIHESPNHYDDLIFFITNDSIAFRNTYHFNIIILLSVNDCAYIAMYRRIQIILKMFIPVHVLKLSKENGEHSLFLCLSKDEKTFLNGTLNIK